MRKIPPPTRAIWFNSCCNSAERWVIESALILPGAILAGMMPQGILGFVPIAIFLAVMAYHWFVIRVALDGALRETLAIFLLNIGVGIATSLWARSILF